MALASNRQKKLLRFFGIAFGENISHGAAGWEIASVMSIPDNKELWRRYVFVTKDFGDETNEIKPFNLNELKSVEIPDDWNPDEQYRQFRDELVNAALRDESPFDRPQPDIIFADRTFIFTGKFKFGSRKSCQGAIVARGGIAPDKKGIGNSTDYLVIGVDGSPSWIKAEYGNKIADAIICRRGCGKPAIVSEAHWVTALGVFEKPRG